MLPDRVRLLDVAIGGTVRAGQLIKSANYEFRYVAPEPEQPAVALLMPPAQKLTWEDSALFAPMDQTLPEGDLYARIRDLFPKQPLTPMHLLALVGRHGIGRLGYGLPGAPDAAPPRVLTREELLRTRYSPQMFAELVAAYLSSGAGISGVQPKIMVPGRGTIPIRPSS
jgi:serine/threonine-protein kinase HipA